MPFLALLLLGPWLLILTWAYWNYPKSLPRVPLRRCFDVGILLLAATAAVVLARYGFVTATDAAHPHHIGVWQMLAPVLYAYGGFATVLALGLLLRTLGWRRKHAQPSSPTSHYPSC